MVTFTAAKQFANAKPRFWYAALDPSRVTLTTAFYRHLYSLDSAIAAKERDTGSFVLFLV